MRVIIATDGSDNSLEAARRALASFPGAEFEVVTVVDAPVDPEADAGGFEGPLIRPDEADEMNRERLAAGDEALAATVSELGDATVTTHLLQGDAGEGIVELARVREADVVVVGSRGHGRLKRLVLGSVSGHVTHHAPCPVLVVPHHS